MITITHPKAGDIDFPDGTSDSDIAKAMRQLDAETGGGNQSPPPPAGRGMGDLRMAESAGGQRNPPAQPIAPYSSFGQMAPPPRDDFGAGRPVADVAKFAGNVANSYTTGFVNAPIQAFQDEGYSPAGFGRAVGNTFRNIADPFRTGPNRIQSSEASLERMGVTNEPSQSVETLPTYGMGQGVGQAQQVRNQSGNAKIGGMMADFLIPTPLAAIKPVQVLTGLEGLKSAGATARAGLAKIADPIGAKLESFGVGQSKSITPFLSRHIRDGADHETFFKEGLMGPKDEIFAKGKALKKELGRQQGEIIMQGRDQGVRINGLEEIDKLLSPHLADPGASLAGSRLTDPASQAFLEKAKKFITRLSPQKDGVLDLRQAQTVKQWLQKQAEYTGPADAAGIPLVAEPGEAALTAADLGHQFKATIEAVAPPELAEINKRLNKLYPVVNAAGWRQMIRDRAPPVNLKDYVGIGQIITSPIWAASKIYGSGRVADAIYKLGTKLRSAKTQEEASKYIESLKKIGMDAEDINSAVAISKSSNGIPKNEDELASLFEKLKFGEKTNEAPAQIDPWEAMDPRNRATQPTGGQGTIEDLAPPEMAQGRQQAGQDAREAFVRQGRNPLDIKSAQEAGPEVKVIPRPPPKKKTQFQLFNYYQLQARKDQMKALFKSQGREIFKNDIDKALEDLGRSPVPKVPTKEPAPFKSKPKRDNRQIDTEEEGLRIGSDYGNFVPVKAEDAPKEFYSSGRLYTKGKTLYGKTAFKDDKGKNLLFENNDPVHMDAPPKADDKGYPSDWDAPPAPTLKESLKGKTMEEKRAIVKKNKENK